MRSFCLSSRHRCLGSYPAFQLPCGGAKIVDIRADMGTALSNCNPPAGTTCRQQPLGFQVSAPLRMVVETPDRCTFLCAPEYCARFIENKQPRCAATDGGQTLLIRTFAYTSWVRCADGDDKYCNHSAVGTTASFSCSQSHDFPMTFKRTAAAVVRSTLCLHLTRFRQKSK